MNNTIQELESFVEEWKDTEERNKEAFLDLKEHLETKPDVTIEFIPRPGITYSLRVSHKKQEDKPLFVMVDVIDEEVRWLSVCFYGDMINDPDEKGDFVPEGLLGENAVCFDLYEYNEEDIVYIKGRLDEAYNLAGEF
jgi:hypothetical protein